MDKHILAKSRAQLNQKIRNFFNQQDFIEVETPLLTTHPGMEPHLTPFETKFHNPQKTKSIPLYLNTSPELYMKKLLGQGFQKIYNLSKVFRNTEHGGGLHNPEFTMLEWYRQKANYKDLMTDCENLILSLLQEDEDDPNPSLTYQGTKIDLIPPWPRKSIHQLFQQYCDIDLLKNKDYHSLKKTAEQKGYDTNACQNWDDIFFKIFLNYIEPNLDKTRPVFVYDYPATQAALARKKTKNPFWAERFELYIGGLELANAFSELIDPKEQEQRLKEEQELRRKLNKTVFDIDQEFLEALHQIKHPSAGIALGVDRLFMILLDLEKIEEVVLFTDDYQFQKRLNLHLC